MSHLLSIKDTVQNAADAISAALNMAICIVDDSLVVVGGTAKYRALSGCVLDTNCIYRKVLDSREKLLLTNPGTNELCRPCRLFNNCPETAEMDCPIIMDSRIIGIISLVSFDEKQAGNMVKNKESLFAFIERMAELIVSKAKEKQKTDELALFARKVEAIMSSVQEGIIAVNENGKIIHINPSAEFILSIDREGYMGEDIRKLIPGTHITSALTDGREYSDIEIDCTVNGKTIRKYNNLLNRSIAGMTDEAAKIVLRYPWPGNVRELENAIEYASNMCTSELLGIEHLPERVIAGMGSSISEATTGNIKNASKELEKNIIIDNMKKFGSSTKDKEMIARKLGISLSTLYRRLRG